MTRLTTPRAAATRDDSGSSLAEVLITMMIGMLLLGIVMTTTINAQRLTRQQSTRSDNTTQASVAIDAMTKSLRSAIATCDSSVAATCAATPLAVAAGATPTSVTFYAAVGNTYTGSGAAEVAALPGAKKVRLSVDAQGALHEDLFMPALFGAAPGRCCAYPATPSSSRVIASSVVAAIPGPPPSQLFTYVHMLTGAALPTPLSSADAALVGSVRIDLLVQGKTTPPVPGTRVANTVVLMNVAG